MSTSGTNSLFESQTLSSINQEKPFTSMIGPVKWKVVEHARRNVAVYIECEDGQTKSEE